MLFRDRSGDEEIQALRLRVNLRAREVIAGLHQAARRRAHPGRQVEPTAEALTNGLAGLALWWIDNPDVPKGVPVDVGTRIVTATL